MIIKEIEKGKIKIEDFTSLDFYHNAEIIQETKPLNNPLVISAMGKDIDILEPVNDGEEFLVKLICEVNRHFSDNYTNFNFKNRYYGDLFPDFKDVVYPYFKEAYKTKNKTKLQYYFYDGNNLKFIIDSVIIYENEELWVISDNITPMEDELVDENIKYYNETKIIDKYATSILNTESVAILHDVKEGKHFYPNKIYSLTESEKEVYDDDKCMISEFMLEDDREEFYNQLSNLSQDNSQFSLKFKILTPKNNVKTFNCYVYAIYGENSELDKIFYFLKDITKYNLTVSKLNELNNNIYAIQILSRAAIFYLDLRGNYVWTSNIREIIESPKYDYTKPYNIIEDLVIDEDKFIFESAIKSLNSYNSLQNFKVRIKTLKGNIKVLNIVIKNVYDGLDNVINSSMQVYDITKENVETRYINLVNAFNAVSSHLRTAIIYNNGDGLYRPSKVIKDLTGISAKNWEESGYKEFSKNIINIDQFNFYRDKLFNNEINEFNMILEYKYKGNPDDIRVFNYYLCKDNKDILGYIEDITESARFERNLKELNEEKSILLKEVHHRVKNNLQVLSSLLNLEERFYKNEPEEILKSTKKRLHSIALMHEMTYGSMNLETVNLKEYFEIFDREIFGLYDDEHLILENEVEEDTYLPLKKVTPLILIVNELVSNSIKYAFDYEDEEKQNIISKKIKFDNGYCILDYKDNGKGLHDDFDINTSAGLGWTIINSFIKQLSGKVEEIDSEGIGFRFIFPINGD